MRSKHQRTQRMVPQSCYSSTGATQARSPTSRGTHARTGSSPAWPKTTSFRSGRWLRTYTMMMRMNCQLTNLLKALSFHQWIFCSLIVCLHTCCRLIVLSDYYFYFITCGAKVFAFLRSNLGNWSCIPVLL